MNALEREYRDNIERSRIREQRRACALAAIGGVTVAGAYVWIAGANRVVALAVCVLVNAVSVYASRRLVRVNPPEETEISPAEYGYRDAPLPTCQQPAKVTSAAQRVIGLVLLLAALTFLAFNWDHVSSRFVSNMLTLIGMLLVIGGQRVHAAWKKRHDAKLMIEWERRLEEKG